jgi:hypothetical protein
MCVMGTKYTRGALVRGASRLRGARPPNPAQEYPWRTTSNNAPRVRKLPIVVSLVELGLLVTRRWLGGGFLVGMMMVGMVWTCRW